MKQLPIAAVALTAIAGAQQQATTELGAILLSGAAGLHVGRTMAFPGDRSILAAMRTAGVRAAQVMAGCTIMLIVAGLLEGYVRQLVGQTPARFAIGGTMLLIWVLYFALVPAPRERDT